MSGRGVSLKCRSVISGTWSSGRPADPIFNEKNPNKIGPETKKHGESKSDVKFEIEFAGNKWRAGNRTYARTR